MYSEKMKLKEQVINEIDEIDWFESNIFNLNMFGAYLKITLHIDGFEIYDGEPIVPFLTEIITEAPIPDNQDRAKVYSREIVISNETDALIYPDSRLYYTELGSFFLCIHHLIYHTGDQLLINPPANKYGFVGFWLNDEDTVLYFFRKVLRDFEKKYRSISTSKKLAASEQILHAPQGVKISNQDTFLVKEVNYERVIERIKHAIDSAFYLEAISLQESAISDKLSLLIFMRTGKSSHKKNTLFNLISAIRSEFDDPILEKIDSWRKKRNHAAHSIVRSLPTEEQVSLNEFDKNSKKVAVEGLELLHQISQFYFENYVQQHRSIFYLCSSREYEMFRNDVSVVDSPRH